MSTDPNARTAIVIGIDDYQNIDPLYGSRRDAEEISLCLTMTSSDFHVELLVNTDATRAGILETIGRYAYSTETGDTLLIYFSGHGVVKGRSGYLCTHDATQYDPGISLASISALMEDASDHFEHVILILDCCHAGAATMGSPIRGITANDIEREIAVVNYSRSILGACTNDSYALELGGLDARGLFTDVLIRGLLGDAVNFDGEITLLGLYEYAAKAMNRDVQDPVFRGDITGTVVLINGLEPRQGVPIEPAQVRHVISKGQSLLDEYRSIEHSEMNDIDRKVHGGSKRCATELQDVARWFEETNQSLPDLAREEHWSRLKDEVLAAQRRLADVVEGEQTEHGTLRRKIGEGGFGQVWEVVRHDGTTCALKIFHGSQLFDFQKVARFKNGFQNMRKLDHPHVVGVHNLTLAPLAFTMQYIPANDLSDYYIDPMDHERKMQILLGISETLIHAHGRSVRHRDIKPANIIVMNDDDDTPVPYLTDFDLAYHETNRTITTNYGVGGVINYAAPEQLHTPNNALARQATVDVYSIAQIMHYIMVGRDPSGEKYDTNMNELSRALRDWPSAEAVAILLDLYGSCTQRNPKDRPQTISEVHLKLVEAMGHLQNTNHDLTVNEDEFCKRVAYLYGGIGSYAERGEDVHFLSKSQGISIELRPKGWHNDETIDVELEFSVTKRLAFQDRTSASARDTLNRRIDRMTSKSPNLTRRNGKKGQYQVFIDAKKLTLEVSSIALLVELIVDIVSTIES